MTFGNDISFDREAERFGRQDHHVSYLSKPAANIIETYTPVGEEF